MPFKLFNIIVLVGLSVLTLLNFYLFNRYVHKEIDEVLINTIRQNLYNLSLNIESRLNEEKDENLRILLDRANASSREIVHLYINDDRNETVLQTDYSAKRRLPDFSTALPIDRLTSENISDTELVDMQLYRLAGLEKIPYTLYAALNKPYIEQTLQHLFWLQLLYPLYCMLFFLGLYWVLYWMVVKPLLGLDAYVRGERRQPPHARIKELQNLSKSVQQQFEKLKELAYIDPLTGVQNRRSIEESLDFAIALAKREKQPFALALIDLDLFKMINDTYGHDAGDQLLIQMTQRIRSHLRAVDQIGRLGGDEFLIIFHHEKRRENIVQALERIRHLFEEPFSLNGQRVTCTISIGLSFYPEKGDNKERLFKAVDQAMYRAKRSGGNALSE